MVIIYPTVIQPLFNKFTPLAEGDLRNRVEALATKLKFPLKHLYEIDGSTRSSHSNAYFFGLPWVNLIVATFCLTYDAQSNRVNILSSMTHSLNKAHPKKLKRSLVSSSYYYNFRGLRRTPAHELGHWYYLHPSKLLFVSQFHLFTIIALFPAFLHAPPLLRSFDFSKTVAAHPPTIVAFLLFQVYPSLFYTFPCH
jgi:STE24 endopeptidase